MTKKKYNPNKSFMTLNAVLFIAVLAVTGIFLYMSYAFKRDLDKKTQIFKGGYQIEIAPDFTDEHISMYINDSLILNRTMPDSTLQVEVQRFAEEHMLIIVDQLTDNSTPFNLHKDGGKVLVKKVNGEVVLEETPAHP